MNAIQLQNVELIRHMMDKGGNLDIKDIVIIIFVNLYIGWFYSIGYCSRYSK
jgi:hypothetical protein